MHRYTVCHSRCELLKIVFCFSITILSTDLMLCSVLTLGMHISCLFLIRHILTYTLWVPFHTPKQQQECLQGFWIFLVSTFLYAHCTRLYCTYIMTHLRVKKTHQAVEIKETPYNL